MIDVFDSFAVWKRGNCRVLGRLAPLPKSLSLGRGTLGIARFLQDSETVATPNSPSPQGEGAGG